MAATIRARVTLDGVALRVTMRLVATAYRVAGTELVLQMVVTICAHVNMDGAGRSATSQNASAAEHLLNIRGVSPPCLTPAVKAPQRLVRPLVFPPAAQTTTAHVWCRPQTPRVMHG